MKLVQSNGQCLEVRDVGPVLFRLTQRAGGVPIKVHGTMLLAEDAARELLREQLEMGLYDGGRVPGGGV